MNVAVDMATSVGSVSLPNPILTASGTSGYSTELAPYMDLTQLGAFLPKGLTADAAIGNPAPRVHEFSTGMLNSIAFGPAESIETWVAQELPKLKALGVRVVAAIWGNHVDDYARSAEMLSKGRDSLIALEVNVACPNTDSAGRLFGASASATAEAVEASAIAGLPMWAKLSAGVTDVVEIAQGAVDAGAEALTLINTMPAMAIDIERRTYRLGAKRGGLSGPPIHPIAVRVVHDCRAAFPEIGIVGVGGVTSGDDAIEFLMAGANAVQVGTATFADPRAPLRVLREVERWCVGHDVGAVSELIGVIHDNHGN